ncbi:class I SAM-dependent methyltransferase [Phyllobacterium lublinensis]|uniref:class I SAM-dependent methyltransferase n=1 Tax=Phyllobacterium lublinensis TaxID=2875708 RepID=UPI001CC96777|nr:class I SAM-dependent methyltransferase [Phyllobacterium sp. 2063]MBZ9654891.1 class I SAM-dependent methyltransferase [Phyllobacterium sp. 2063]
MTATDRQAHWQNVYSTKAETELSWYEDTPEFSLSLLREAGLNPELCVIDVGGGASRLVDALLASGQTHVSVLDLSSAALATAQSRLENAKRVHWIVSDVTVWTPDRQYDFWHDRAAFHFLTATADQQAYARVLSHAVKKGGKVIIGTFAIDGPEKCSGLPVIRHSAESIQAVLGEHFELASTRRHEHTTPWGAVQNFQFSTFEKVADADAS